MLSVRVTDAAERWVKPQLPGRNYAFAFRGETRDYFYYLVERVDNTIDMNGGINAHYRLVWPTGLAIKDRKGNAQRFATAEEAADALKNNWAEYAAGYNIDLHGRLEEPRPSWAYAKVAKRAEKGWLDLLWQGMAENKGVPIDPASIRSRLDLVLALGQHHLEATGCSPQAHLGGERAPCGAIVVTDAGGGTFATAIVTSKPRSSLHLDPNTHINVSPRSASPAARAAYDGMNRYLSGPHYGNIYVSATTSGLVNAPSTTGNPSGCCRGNATAESVALDQIAAMGVEPLVGDKLGAGVAKAFAPVREAVAAKAGQGVQVYTVPFVSSY